MTVDNEVQEKKAGLVFFDESRTAAEGSCVKEVTLLNVEEKRRSKYYSVRWYVERVGKLRISRSRE